MKITIGHLYPDQMNIYGDRGNIIALSRRARWAGLEVAVEPIGLAERPDLRRYDILFLGGGQDREQSLVAEDLVGTKAPLLRQAVEDGLVVLAVCGGYQLLGRYVEMRAGGTLEGVGVFDAWTVADRRRYIGDIIVECDLDRPRTLVGFENHSGRTYLDEGARPLGRVVAGYGNNAADGLEGAIHRHAFGTYLHGSLLPKNPWLTDLLIRLAVERRHGRAAALQPVDDGVENEAHRAAIARIQRAR